MGNLQSNASPSIEKEYEVFLNFRGEDTRDGFTNYLYEALLRKRIRTFMDKAGIEKGEEIWSKLPKAITNSMIFVVIFSKEYASSECCLRELVEIMECEKKNPGTVIPVFYKVTVDDVSHQKGSFKDGFDQLEKNFLENLEKEQVDSEDVDNRKKQFYEQMQKWKQALEAACNRGGWPYEKGYESEVIAKIVEDIWKKLMKAYKLSPRDFDGRLFGIEERLKQVMTLLCLDNNDIRIIGIWGMGGLGKTTIADAIYHQISNDEYGKCFIKFRERLGERKELVSVLRQNVLSQVFNDEEIKLDDSLTLPPQIKHRLYQKKVFIVFDDVDDFFKLKDLAGGLDRLSPGSRIVMTTRDMDILRQCQVNDDYIYKVKGLPNEEAEMLFRESASIQSPLTEDLRALLDETLEAIDGNPLGLKVAGSLLLKLNKLECQDVLNRLKKAKEIHNVLRISYDQLGEEDRHAFLDIACFFVGEHKDYVAKMLNFSSSLDVLLDRSLITKPDDEIIEMHDLLQEMGRKIVCEEDLNNPFNRSRLWTQEDVLNTLKNGNGTNAIRGIVLDMSNMNAEHLDSKAFENMRNLRFLKFCDPTFNEYVIFSRNPYHSKVHFPNGIGYLSSNLRSLDWLGCPLKALPSNFNPQKLVAVNLTYGKIKKLWEGKKEAPNLKWILLKSCPSLVKVIDGSRVPLLKTIDIEDCNRFHGFTSHNHFPSLTCLRLSRCDKLNHFPSLTYLRLSRCDKLTEISDRLHAPSLETIVIQYCENLRDFPPPVEHFNNLRTLKIQSCKNLQSFPNNISFPSLTCLDLSDCFNRAWISVTIDAPLLEHIGLALCKLSLRSNSQFSSLKGLTLQKFDPTEISYLLFVAPLLEKIDLYHCISLLEFSSPVYHVFNNLRELRVTACHNLQSFGKNIHFPSLVSVDLSECHSLTELSDLSGAPRLEKIILIGCRSLLHFPTPCHHFDNLQRLILDRCENLQSFPSDIHFPSLTYLSFTRCINLTMFPNISGKINELWMTNTAIHEVPSTIENLPELDTLVLSECTELKVISTSICKLKALSYLDLSDCSALECFPEILDTMESLKVLDLSGTAIKGLHHSIEKLRGLEQLLLRECRNLEMLPISICNFTSLLILDRSGWLKVGKADFGETFVEEQGKIRKFSDEAKTSGGSNEDVIEPDSKRTCS